MFSQARENARKSACLSNLKQISQAIQIYTQDWDECFPFSEYGHISPGGGVQNPASADWLDGIYPYVKNVQVFACPSRGVGQGICPVLRNRNPVWNTPNIRINYGFSEPIAKNCSGIGSLSSLKHPADTVIVAESTCHWLGGYWDDQKFFLRRIAFTEQSDRVGCGCPPSGIIPPNPEDYTYHAGGSNIGFADGHVKWMKWDQLYTVSRGGTLRYGVCEL